MNVSQFGQNKKKQAVRRLSQGSVGHGKRKVDIRRKLEAKRRLGSSGPEKHERKFPRGRQGDYLTEESGIKRRLGHFEATSKRHASPLAATVITQGSVTTGNKQETNVFTNPTTTAENEIKTDTSEENMFDCNVLKSNPTTGNVFSSGQNPMTSHGTFKKPLQERQNVFVTRGSPIKNQEGRLFDPKTNTSPNKGIFSAVSTESSLAKSHPSPLTGFVNSPSKGGGSIISGLPSQVNTKIGSVASLVEKYEQTATQPSFQTSSSNVFPSAISSNKLLDSQSQEPGMFSMKKDTITAPGSVVKSSVSLSTTASSPNVNLFTVNVMRSASTGTSIFNPSATVDGSANPVGSTNRNPVGSTNPNPFASNNLVGSINPIISTNPDSTQNSVFGGAGFPISATAQSQALFTANPGSKSFFSRTPGIFGNAGSQSNSTNLVNRSGAFSSNNFKTFGSDPSTGSVFGNVGMPVSSASLQNNVSPFSSSTFTISGQAPAKPESAGLGETTASLSTNGGPFTSQSHAMSHSPAKSGGNFGGEGSSSADFGTAGAFTAGLGTKGSGTSSNIPLKTDDGGSAKPASMVLSGTSPSDLLGHSKPSELFLESQKRKQGPFSSASKTKTPDFPQSQNSGSIFGNTGLSTASAEQQKMPGIFSKPQEQTQGPFSSASKTTTPGFPQSQNSGSIFGNTGLSTASTEQQKMAGIFSKPHEQKQDPFGRKNSNPGLSQPANSANIFSNAGLMTSTNTQETSGPFGGKTSNPGQPADSVATAFENTELVVSSGQSAASGLLPAMPDQTQGPFSSGNSNTALAQPSASIFGQAGQSSTMFSARVFSKQDNATFGSVFGSHSQDNQSASISPNENKKGSRRSLSSTDISGLTSILIKDLSAEYMDKKLLERELNVFGPNKVSLQPTKQSAIITFETHESAKKAKSKALELLPCRSAHAFWCKKKGTGRTSKTPEKPSGNQTGFRSRRKSISNALKSIDPRKFQPAITAQERFTVLDEVDKQIRQAITPYTDIANAPVIVGVCCDMCPEKERYMRESQADLSIFEMVPGTQDNRDGDVPKVEHIKAVKEYSRSAADKLEPLAHELRPVHVLQITLDYLMGYVMDNSNKSWGEWFNFLWNRTRAIRKDITQQHLCDVQSTDLVEKITRFHVFCGHYLCEEDMHSFDPKINNENLTKCLQTLKQFYADLYTDQGVKCPKEAEFQAYDILLNLNEGDTLRKAMQYRLEIRNSPEVKFALEVFSSLNSRNFVRFFKLVKSSSYLNACILHRYFTQVRRDALRVMTKAYSPKEPYPLQVIQDLLAFEDRDEASRFCFHYNITTNQESVQFSKMPFNDPERAFPPQRATNVIESKRKCSIGEVVNGSSLISRPLHQPVSSFDSSGRYIGLPNLIHMLQLSAPDTPEPESPYDIYESAGNASFEQQSPVVQEPYHDPRIIFEEAVVSTCVDLLDEAVNGLVKDISERTICQVNLEQQLTKEFVYKLVDDSVSILTKEIAQECIKNELEIKRRKIAVAESRTRMSVVAVNEILDEVLKTELVALARESKRIVHQQLKAQSFTKMSAVVMREMLEDVLLKESHEVALDTRREVVSKKKAMLEKKSEILRRNRMKKYFQTWSKEYRRVIYIRTVLQQIPAKPPMLTAKQQLDNLRSADDSTKEILTRPFSSYSNLIKEREELKKLLLHRANEHEMKRLRAMQPVNLGRLYTEYTAHKPVSKKTSDVNNFMKLLVSFSNHVQSRSLGSIEKVIKSKLHTEKLDESCGVPVELQEKLEQLSENQRISTSTDEFMYDIKACYGILSTDEQRNIQQHHLLLGLTGVLFVLDTSDNQAGDNSFWNRARTRLRQILKSKPSIPGIPLVILNIFAGNSDGISDFEDRLGVDLLNKEGLISDCAVYVLKKPMDSDEVHKQLVHGLLWLMYHNPEMPSLEKDSLVGFVEKEVLKHFTIPVSEEVALRKDALLPPQCPEVIIDLYNSVIDHVIAMVTHIKLQDVSLPVPEFTAADSPPVTWNSTRTLYQLLSVLKKMRLAWPSAAASDGTWNSEYMLCLGYVNALLEKEPLKKFGFALINRVERIFSAFAKRGSDLPSTTLTAADVPWPKVIEACVETLLCWLHNLSDVDNVYYLSDGLDSFKQPPLWTEAVTETVRKASKSDPEKRERGRSSRLRDFTARVEEELTEIETSRSRFDGSERTFFVEDDIPETAQRFERRLEKERRNWARFEKELNSIIDEDDSEHLSFNVHGQGVKRKNPSWRSSFRSEKTNVKKNSITELEDFPDLNLTFSYFETSLASFRDGMEMQRHLEKLTEKRLKEALEDSL